MRLLQSHNLSDITVSALTKEAGVARITFYRNYTEMSDVIFDYLEMSHFGVANDENANLYLPQFVRCYFLFFYENKVLFECILHTNMLERLFTLLENQINAHSSILVSAYGFENPYEISALAGMLLKILMDWLRNGMEESIEEMTIVVFKIITLLTLLLCEFLFLSLRCA